MKSAIFAVFVVCCLSIFSQPATEKSGVLIKLRYADGTNAAEIVREIRIGYQNKRTEMPEFSEDGNILLKECPDGAEVIRASIEYGSEIFKDILLTEVKLSPGNGGKVGEIILPKLQKTTVAFLNQNKTIIHPEKLRGVVTYKCFNEESLSNYLVFTNNTPSKTEVTTFIPSLEPDKNGSAAFGNIPPNEFNIRIYTENAASLPYTLNGTAPIGSSIEIPLIYTMHNSNLKVLKRNSYYRASYSWNGKISIVDVKSGKEGFLLLKNIPPVKIIIWNDNENFVLNPDNTITKLTPLTVESQFYLAMPDLAGKEYTGNIFSTNLSAPEKFSSETLNENKNPGLNVSGYSGLPGNFYTSLKTDTKVYNYRLSFYIPFFDDTDYSTLNLSPLKPKSLFIKFIDNKNMLIKNQLPITIEKNPESYIDELMNASYNDIVYPLSFNNGIYSFNIYNNGKYRLNLDTFNGTYKIPDNFVFDSSINNITISLPDPMLLISGDAEFYWVTRDRPGKINYIKANDYLNFTALYGDKSKILRYWYKKTANELVIFDNKKYSLRKLMNENYDFISSQHGSMLLPTLFTGFSSDVLTGNILRLWQGKYYVENSKSAKILSTDGKTIELPQIKMKEYQVVYSANSDSEEILLQIYPQQNEKLIKRNIDNKISLPVDINEVTAYYPGVGKSKCKFDNSSLILGDPKEVDPLIIKMSEKLSGNLSLSKCDNPNLKFSCDINDDKEILYGFPYGKYDLAVAAIDNLSKNINKTFYFDSKSDICFLKDNELYTKIIRDIQVKINNDSKSNSEYSFIAGKVIALKHGLWCISNDGKSEHAYIINNEAFSSKSMSGLSIIIRDKLLWHDRDKIRLVIEGEGEFKDFLFGFENLNWTVSAETGYMSVDFNYFPPGKWKIKLISNELPKSTTVAVGEYGGYAVFN